MFICAQVLEHTELTFINAQRELGMQYLFK